MWRLRFVCFTVLVNTLNVDKFTVWWMDNGDVYKVTKELITQLINKVGMGSLTARCIHW